MDPSGPWPLWWLDLALCALVAEAVWLTWLGRRPARAAPPLQDWLWGLLAGLSLLLAMRAALAGAALPVVGACLAAGGLCHVMDLRRRLATAEVTRR
jgi:hypothetical protein